MASYIRSDKEMARLEREFEYLLRHTRDKALTLDVFVTNRRLTTGDRDYLAKTFAIDLIQAPEPDVVIDTSPILPHVTLNAPVPPPLPPLPKPPRAPRATRKAVLPSPKPDFPPPFTPPPTPEFSRRPDSAAKKTAYDAHYFYSDDILRLVAKAPTLNATTLLTLISVVAKRYHGISFGHIKQAIDEGHPAYNTLRRIRCFGMMDTSVRD